MAILQAALSPEATARVHDLLLCLAKFGETICIEARNDKVRLQQHNNILVHADEYSAFFHYLELVKNRVRIIRPRRQQLLHHL